MLVGEAMFWEFVVKPAARDKMFEALNVSDETGLLQAPPHFRLVDAGFGLSSGCQFKDEGCFSWEAYRNVDAVIVTNRPESESKYSLVTRSCEGVGCVYSDKLKAYIRDFSAQEHVEYEKHITNVSSCKNADITSYRVEYCVSKNFIDGSELQASYFSKIQHPHFYGWLMPTWFQSNFGLAIYFATGRISATNNWTSKEKLVGYYGH